MSLHDDVDVYLAQRRARGFALTTTEPLLRGFCGWLQARGKSDTFTVDDAVKWACDRPEAAPVWWSQRLTAVRPFAAWLNARDGAVPVIPAALLPVRTTRRDPFIYSQSDVTHLLVACPLFFANVRVAATMATIIGLLAATGLRIGEAIGLTVVDLDTTDNVLTVHGRKTGLERLVPVHPSTTNVLVDYINLPARRATHPRPNGPIFVNYRGLQITANSIEHYYRVLVDALDIARPGQPRPRLHDLRHTFATRHMLAAYTHHDTDPARTLTLLSTWLGHSAPSHTYWYLSAVPELLAAAAARLEPANVEGRAR